MSATVASSGESERLELFLLLLELYTWMCLTPENSMSSGDFTSSHQLQSMMMTTRVSNRILL